MKIFQSILFLIFLSSFISADCTSNQININTASLSELDKLSGIGPAYAQAIIDLRPFSSVDNLIDVRGIGEATLTKIKDQNLACVDEETETDENEEKELDIVILEEKTTSSKKLKTATPISGFVPLEKEVQESSESIINLNNAEQIETIVYESKGEKVNKYLLTGFGVFLIGIISLSIKK